MNNRFGDDSFSKRLHTPLSQLGNRPATNTLSGGVPLSDFSGRQNLPFTVYDITAASMQAIETLAIDSRIDDEARTIFSTYEDTLRQVFLPSMNRLDIPVLQLAKANYDFSLLVSPLSRILELEFNNSIIQIIRREKGIEMPDYYKRVKPGVECVILVGQKAINLNKLKDGKLASLSIGETCILMNMYCHSLAKYLGLGRDIDKLKNFIRKIDRLREYRNESSHTSVMTENDFHNFYREFCSLIRDGWFTLLMDLKDKVKSV